MAATLSSYPEGSCADSKATAKEAKNPRGPGGVFGESRRVTSPLVESAVRRDPQSPPQRLTCHVRWRRSSGERGARSGDVGKLPPDAGSSRFLGDDTSQPAAMLFHCIAALLLICHLGAAAYQNQWSQQQLQAYGRFPDSWILDQLATDDPYPKTPGKRVPVPALYHERYSEQTFIGTHNSAAIRDAENGLSLSGNQYFNVSTQLKAGVRLLQAQGHRDPNGSSDIRLCHFNCALMDGGSLKDHMLAVREFLLENRHEIVTLLFVNTGLPLWQWAKAYYESGLDLMSYVPPQHGRWANFGIEDWPTIAEMVTSNQRVVTFISDGGNENTVPFLLPEFKYLFETNFGIERPDQYPCKPDRPRWPGSYIPDRLSLIDHWLYAKFLGFRYPNATYANETNSASFHEGALGEHAARCRTMYQRRPNFLLVDFFNEGEVFDVEYGMNAN